MKESCFQGLNTRIMNVLFRFIVNMQYAFQDFDNLYLIMDLLTGGDLRYHISKHRRFTEDQSSNYLFLIKNFLSAVLS
jgi:serine/threonine protein kinase